MEQSVFTNMAELWGKFLMWIFKLSQVNIGQSRVLTTLGEQNSLEFVTRFPCLIFKISDNYFNLFP